MKKLKNISLRIGLAAALFYGTYKSYCYVQSTFNKAIEQTSTSGNTSIRNSISEPQSETDRILTLPENYRLLENIVSGRYIQELSY